MIHSPRRISPALQNDQRLTYVNSATRETSIYHPLPPHRLKHMKQPDDLHTSSPARPQTSNTCGSDQISQWKDAYFEMPENLEVRAAGAHQNSPIITQSSMTKRLPKSPPSTSTTLSSKASCSTIGSHSMCTSDSEQDSRHLDRSLPPLQLKHYPRDTRTGFALASPHEFDPTSFDLIVPTDSIGKDKSEYSLETRSDLLFSHEHLHIIFQDPTLLLKFTSYLSAYRVSSIPILVYYLDSIKALKAIKYSNAIAEALEPIPGINFTSEPSWRTQNSDLEEKSQKAFDLLVQEDLPAFITHIYTQTVSLSIQRRITGTLPSHLREASEGLAEVFCMTDPSRPDNPIIFSSEEFHKTTQYGLSYVIGRNCRFLQGPKTNHFSIQRIKEKIEAGVEHCEVVLNYRRDGSPFMNLFMCAPLCDSKGKIRYFIGAQVDVSGLVKECSELESFRRLVARVEEGVSNEAENEEVKDEFQELSEMLNLQELDTVRKWGGRMHREPQDNNSENAGNWAKPRLLINPGSPDGAAEHEAGYGRWRGKLEGIYEHYLLVRPYPNLHILFASPSLRVPGILQSPLMSKIGGSQRVRDELMRAFADGHGVTAKVKWVSKSDPEGRSRWIHCTPLIGANGAIGVWMVVIVNDSGTRSNRRHRMAPPVDPGLGRTQPFSPVRKDFNSMVNNLSALGIREGSLMSEPDSPFSTATFDLRAD
ncbi:unnamed protein product [Blumeria hordei]|uniref:PAC domain-containing protein n=1 Tax=Blumeria hordei TaxID=2867405 RepID=A0A383UML5_BLUHO|nr:unnamed protein product [Blumeria hordei]